MYRCRICGKEFESKSACAGHTGHCKRKNNFQKFTCKCGQVFDNEESYVQHSHCCPQIVGEEKFKINNQIRAKAMVGINNFKNVDRSPGSKYHTALCNGMKGHHHGDKNLQRKGFIGDPRKISEANKRAYRDGRRTPVGGDRFGIKSYAGNYYLRSRYELVVYCLLKYLGINFGYEEVRVVYNGKTYISDFNYGNNFILEVKGWKNLERDSKIIEAFESNGYSIKVIYSETIDKIYYYLEKKGFDMSTLWSKVKEYKNKNNSKLKWDIINNEIVYYN